MMLTLTTTLSCDRAQPSSKILLLLAHPDDEVMFFSPLILSLLSSSSLVPAANLFGISACVGSAGGSDNDAGLGATRARELVDAYEMLGVPRGNVLAMDVEGMKDGMGVRWERSRVVDEVTRAVGGASSGWPTTFDYIVTFDSVGVSGHANHRSVAEAAEKVATRLGSARVLRLTSLPLWAKYGGLPYALLRRLRRSSSATSCSYALSSPAEYSRAAKAMQAHASQLVWFRYGWWALSSYVYGVEFCSSDA